ncbi:FAD-dependent oxidoreductase [Eggerthella sp. YY7918]|uniref:FAD-dependent oxidoreductase n=1 Tax=Eggerthella sp. (strain YY7918) TaxID=502558 RepID=UPI0002171864|nr:FAD-dependent oxidoreductase [Eggerthella sp. YY7918]BAK45667.1 hypothetical protein EGYY_26680 [Eggerthella sp. YY7918]
MVSGNGISRRGFLLGASASAALAAGSMLASCTPQNANEQESASTGAVVENSSSSAWLIEDLEEPTEIIDCEFCVIGDGGSGVAAAIQAHQLGVDVVLLAKQQVLGGSFIGSEGLCAWESHWQEDAGEKITAEEAMLMCEEFHHWIPDPALYSNFFKRTADTVTWLESLGVEFDHVQSLCGSPVCWHVYKGDHYSGTGVTFMESFSKAAEAEGIRIEYSCPAKKLIVENGAITGVIAKRDDDTVVQINCKAAFVGTGGWANNIDLIEELNGADTNRIIASGMIGRDGDGVKMMRDVGAALALCPGTMMFYGPIMPGTTYGTQLSTAVSLEPTLWVNQDGSRYTDESMFNTNFAYAGNSVHNQKRAFNIFTQERLDYYKEHGGKINVGVYTVADEPMDRLEEEWQKFLETDSEYLFQANTIEELAEAMGLEPEAQKNLKVTFDTYNSYCDKGKDLEFGKDKEHLNSLANGGILYAAEIFNGYFTTVGGIKVNQNTEVLNEEGQVINGLYSGGSDAGGLYGDTYDVARAAGSQASWAVNSGRIGAICAAQYLGKEVDPTI